MANNEKLLIQLEKRMRGKMKAIELKEITAKDSEIGKLFPIMKNLDEVLYEKLLKEYVAISKKLAE